MESLIPFAALGISALSLVATQLWAMRTARTNYVAALEKRVDKLEEDYRNCEEEKSRLRQEVIEVYRELAKGGGKLAPI